MMRPVHLARSVLLVLALGLAACGGDDATEGDAGGGTVGAVSETSGPESTPPSSAPPSPSPSSLVPATEQPVPDTSAPRAGSAPAPGSASPAAERAVADLAAREDTDPAAIKVVSQENVTWSDSSLGCPEDGMLYAQVLTDGIRIVLELDGRRYEYHGGGSRPEPFYCEKPQPPVGG